MKRCFGIDKKIIDCEYSYIKTLRTVKQPHLPLPTLKEVVEFVRDRDVWLLLDIKVDNVADDVMRLTAEAIKSVHGGGTEYWREKIVLGCWTLKFLPVSSVGPKSSVDAMLMVRSSVRSIFQAFRLW